MTELTQEEELLDGAIAEEKNYNWLEAAKLYEQVANNYRKKNLMEKTAEIYSKLGYIFSHAAYTVKNSEKLLEYIKQTIKAYTEAMKIFGQIGNISKKLGSSPRTYRIKARVSSKKTNFI